METPESQGSNELSAAGGAGEPAEDRGWWRRPCGGRDVLAIALPLVISTGTLSLMLFVDRMFLLWHSPAEMAASLPAGTLYWALVCLPLGIAGYTNTFVAQYHGADRPERVGLVTWQGFAIGVAATPLYLLAIPVAPLLFRLAGHESPLADHESVYLRTLLLGAGATVMAEALGAFYTGRGLTSVVMLVNVAATVLNGVLDYAWIFGRWGFPELGIEGAAWGTVVASWVKLAVFLVLVLRADARFGARAGLRLDAAVLRRLVLFGAPNGLQFVVECGAFAAITLAMGRFGERAMAATTLAFNVNMVAFIPMIGVSVAVSTLVGQQLTRGRPDLAERATWTAVALALAYSFLFALAYLTVPRLLMMGHASGLDHAEFAEIQELAVVLLRFVAAYCMFDALQLLFAAAIKGAGDTWFVLGNTTIVSSLVIGVGAWGSRGDLLWWWYVVTTWIGLLWVTFLARFLHGRWRTMRVIEA